MYQIRSNHASKKFIVSTWAICSLLFGILNYNQRSEVIKKIWPHLWCFPSSPIGVFWKIHWKNITERIFFGVSGDVGMIKASIFSCHSQLEKNIPHIKFFFRLSELKYLDAFHNYPFYFMLVYFIYNGEKYNIVAWKILE